MRPLSTFAFAVLAACATSAGCGEGPAAHLRVPPLDVGAAPRDERATADSSAPRFVSAVGVGESPAQHESPRSLVAIRPTGPLKGEDRLARLFEALRKLEAGAAHDDVRILQYGDSHTASDSATAYVRRILQSRFGRGGRGYVALGAPWKNYVQDGIRSGMTPDFEPQRNHGEDGHIVGDGCYGLLGAAVGAERRGARAFTQCAIPATRIEIDYWQQPMGGTLDVFIDGAHAGHIATRAAEAAPGFSSFDVPDAPHMIEVVARGDGRVRVFGAALDRADAGVVVDALGINGAQVSTPLHWNESHFAAQLQHRSPDLVVLAYGTNEALDPKLNLSDYERSLLELLGRVERAVPPASCLLLGPPDLARPVATPRGEAWATWPRLLEIVATQTRVARATGCAFYDQLEAMGGPGSIAAWATDHEPRANKDRVHLTRSGYQQLGTSFATDLVRAYDASLAPGAKL